MERESPLSVTLVQAWIATDKLDWVIEKSVELGVQSIVLTPAQRAVVRVAGDRLAKRLARLRELIVALRAVRTQFYSGNRRGSTFASALHAGLSEGAMGLLLDHNSALVFRSTTRQSARSTRSRPRGWIRRP